MAEEIAFENGQISNFWRAHDLDLTLDRVILHTVVHHSSNSTYMPNVTEIKETFNTGFSRSTQKSWPNIHWNGHKHTKSHCQLTIKHTKIFSNSYLLKKYPVFKIPLVMVKHTTHIFLMATAQVKGKDDKARDRAQSRCSCSGPDYSSHRWINHWSVTHGQCDARPIITFPAVGHHYKMDFDTLAHYTRTKEWPFPLTAISNQVISRG